MSRVFLDTVGLLALWDTDDQWHSSAARAFADLKQSKSVLITTSFVLLECATQRLGDPTVTPSNVCDPIWNTNNC